RNRTCVGSVDLEVASPPA
ncbi:unnamed protein product, partial [Rotaria magnacalcarata]